MGLLSNAESILKFGGAGLAFLLAFMAYALLRREHTATRPGQSARLSTVRWFMGFAIVLSLASVASEVLLSKAKAGADMTVPCNRASGYPRGRWLVSGYVMRAVPPHSTNVALAWEVNLKSDNAGLVATNEKGALLAKTDITGAFRPNGSVIFTTTDSTGYQSTFHGTISENGCFIEGDFDDTNTHVGHEILFWDARDRYRVLN